MTTNTNLQNAIARARRSKCCVQLQGGREYTVARAGQASLHGALRDSGGAAIRALQL